MDWDDKHHLLGIGKGRLGKRKRAREEHRPHQSQCPHVLTTEAHMVLLDLATEALPLCQQGRSPMELQEIVACHNEEIEK